MRRQHGRVSGEAVVEFLLFESRFPRSLRYCLKTALGLVERLVAARTGGMAEAHGRLQALDRWLDGQQKNGLAMSDHALLTHVVDETGAACGALQKSLAARDLDMQTPPPAVTQQQSNG
jgi:uncharacterized alpha-E superfamily protein